MTDSLHRLILASGSIYRKELLSRLHLPFDVITPTIDETIFPEEQHEAAALRLAQQKAQAVAKLVPGAIIIGSDQVATLDGMAIGKPGTHEKAFEQLKLMRGKEVVFHTALCVVDDRASAPFIQLDNVQTKVKFRDLPESDLDAYLRIEMPYDCAGSAKNEGLGIALLERIDSNDPTALTGLPLIALTGMLRKVGMNFFRAY